MRPLRALAKLLRGLLHIAVGLWTIYVRFPQLPPSHQEARVQAWAQRLLQLWGIELVLRGTPTATGPMLLVANHISWLDIVVMHAARHCRFVSKSEVQGWPLVGVMASAAGTLYIERAARRDTRRMVHEMAQALRNGDVVAVFPEGTTGDGMQLLPFHGNLLEAAIAADAPVQPVALQFLDGASGALSTAPVYVGDDSLIGSIWRTLRSDGLQAVVSFGPPEQAQGRDRRGWAKDLRERVDALRR